MTKKIKTLSSLFTLLVIMFLAPRARALETAGFKFVYGDASFEVNAGELLTFKEISKIPEYSLLQNRFKPEAVLAAYFGTKAPDDLENNFKTYEYSPKKIYSYLKKLALEINVTKTEPVLEIQEGKTVNFSPPKKGLALNLFDSTFLSVEALALGQSEAKLLVETDEPLRLLSETNNLGINELLAAGESNFKGSPKNRIHNIKVGIEKFKGVIVKPKEEFSFNKFLGPVEAEQGFLPELVIKRTGTVPELGGGLCQVSSTTFRAAMNAGLPITQRKNHAYAVQYYSPQGTDATIYPGAVDLKFINDTPGAILIWPYIKDGYTLVFEFYGSRDSRKVTLQKPISYDRKEGGSLKAEWTRIVEKDGNVATSTFKSIYQSPALFHKQEEFVPATTAPASGLQIN